jgi:hypothetical protein
MTLREREGRWPAQPTLSCGGKTSLVRLTRCVASLIQFWLA